MRNTDLTWIAGPCSAESPEQLRTIARSLSGAGLFAFRAGIWKPRTRPGAFEGAGDEGIKWLKDLQDEFGIAVITEVANPYHVEKILKAGFTKCWIGARTTSNPFSVQELAESLSHTNLTVLIKNPTNPDLTLWMGGVERIQKAGITDLIAVHRGFSTYEKKKYRNLPNWQLPLDFKKEFPAIPLLCDPSHISGVAVNVPMVAQMAVDLKFDGLMVEVHHNPVEAWTDAKQQLSCDAFLHMVDSLAIRNREVIDQEEIRELRADLSVIDEQLIRLLVQRMERSEQIGAYKKRNHLVIFQTEQWKESLNKFIQMAEKLDLSSEFAIELFKLIHQESIAIQSKVFEK